MSGKLAREHLLAARAKAAAAEDALARLELLSSSEVTDSMVAAYGLVVAVGQLHATIGLAYATIGDQQ